MAPSIQKTWKDLKMSTFSLRDEYFVNGKEYDSELVGEEDYQPHHVEFIIAWCDGTWIADKRHLPIPFSHEKCSDQDRIDWYHRVVLNSPEKSAGVVFVGVLFYE